jgi:two-component system, OmpR family, sensor histidine kinase KdpD
VADDDEIERAREALEGRAEIAARLAHEIRGPVSTIRGLAGTTLAHYDGLSDEERREFLGLIRHEAERLEQAVEQVALALRLDAGSVRFDLRPRDLAEVVRDAAETTDVGDHPLELDASDPLEASIDAGLVARVVRQLVDNAAKFSPPGSPITVRVRRDGGDGLIEVIDRGPGIPPDRRQSVFERFADWRPPGYEDRPGAGLGLYICRAVASAHGGDASIAEGPQGGTMLRIRLPAEG